MLLCKVWGNGIPLSNPDCINPKKFKNQGILGSMLEQVREILLGQAVNPIKENILSGSLNSISIPVSDVPLPNRSAMPTLPLETTTVPE